ncbi:MAG: 3-methyl-2-oxobutanoate hydroxymethyltransferase, partial [Muribaculaceae bacterium]|nr:3-methyl-2-oxobutanoate hydroxymethyltransferase [Muribaculaceae bacterium]
SAIRIMKESGAEAVKIEGGSEMIDCISRIVAAGIPVMGHLGLTPQSVNQFGSYGLRAKGEAEAEKLKRDAQLLQQAGCFAIVLEKIPAALAAEVSRSLTVPTIGIGAGVGCDGQVLVVQDALGMNQGFSPKFLRKYADLATTIKTALGQYIADVKSEDFPSATECY